LQDAPARILCNLLNNIERPWDTERHQHEFLLPFSPHSLLQDPCHEHYIKIVIALLHATSPRADETRSIQTAGSIGGATVKLFGSQYNPFYSERCQSGRLGRSRKPLWSLGHRGFESHPLRQKNGPILGPFLILLLRLYQAPYSS
jgi:hypothetical protein